MSDRWISFDCYGTLVDWRTGLLAALETAAPGHGPQLLALHRRVEGEIEARGHQPYRDVLAQSLARMAEEAGVGIDPAHRDVLAETLPTWPVYADTGPALQALADDGWRIAILSNVDDDLIAGTLTRFPVPIDCVVTAQEVRSYKPGPAHFERLLARTGVDPARWVHAAVNLEYDLLPAAALGATTVWVNREHEPAADVGLLAEIETLEPLARVVRGVVPDDHETGVTP